MAKETRQLLVKLPIDVYEALAQDAAKETLRQGREVTKQSLLIDAYVRHLFDLGVAGDVVKEAANG